MLKIGSHVGMSGPDYYLGSVKEALSYNANTFMFYTGAPQNSIRVPLSNLKIDKALATMKENGIDPKDVVVHAPYLINLANLDPEKADFSYNILVNELNRTAAMCCKYMVLHPGSSLNYDRKSSLDQIIFLLNKALSFNDDVIILLETMAGKGNEVGINFDEIAYMINGIDKKECIGVCLDTCHINDGGYDISNPDMLLEEFDKKISLNYLKVIHVNDSKNPINSHKDRHENIGYGTLGFDNIINFIYHPLLADKIFILETPYIKEHEKDKISYPPYKFEIASIRNKSFNDKLINDVIEYYKSID